METYTIRVRVYADFEYVFKDVSEKAALNYAKARAAANIPPQAFSVRAVGGAWSQAPQKGCDER